MQTTPSSLAPLVVTTRGSNASNQTIENVHFGAVVVVNANGHVLAHAGDPNTQVFTRSTIKPFQALPFVEAGGPRMLGYSSEQTALLCASHSGEEFHVKAVRDMLVKARSKVDRLQCGCHAPLMYAMQDKPAPEGDWDAAYHNCSGKHSGMLGMCAIQGWDDSNYLDIDSPLQSMIRLYLAQAVGLTVQDMPWGVDGCSAPNYAMPLAKLAYGYARLAQGGSDTQFGASFDLLRHAMTRHPEYVSGTGRNDDAFMRAGRGDWVSKVGADGVQVVASTSRRQAFAIKVSDTNKPALFAACIEVMEQLGWLEVSQKEVLAPWRAGNITSARGAVVGHRKPVVQLEWIGARS